MAWKTLIATALFVILELSACRSDARKNIDEKVNIGTHSLHIRCIGQGSPTVVIDTGIGDSLERWNGFQSQIAEFAHVCSYDRAGYGSSEPGPMPRHSQQIAYELHVLLESAGIRGHYVLLGHSLGGVNMQVFADQYPTKVVGLILLDPPPITFITGQAFPELYKMFQEQENKYERMAEAAGQSTNNDTQAYYLKAIASEHASLIQESASQVAAIETFGDLPLIVIGSGIPNQGFGANAESFQNFWIEQNRDLADKSTKGTFVFVKKIATTICRKTHLM